MTKLLVLAVRDNALQAYAAPIFVPTTALAMRMFTDEVNREARDNQMNQHPDDFELWQLAEFDNETGNFTTNTPARIARAKDLKQSKE